MAMLMVLVGSVSAALPNVWASDSSGGLVQTFYVNDDVYVKATGLPTSATCYIYIVTNQVWTGGEAILADEGDGKDITSTDALGNLGPRKIWTSAHKTGYFDVVIDCCKPIGCTPDGKMGTIGCVTAASCTDGVDDFTVGHGLEVVPESVIAVALIALLVPGMIYVVRRKKK